MKHSMVEMHIVAVYRKTLKDLIIQFVVMLNSSIMEVLIKILEKENITFIENHDPNNTVTYGYIHMIDAKGPLSGKHGFEFKKIPAGLTYSVT